MAEESGSSTSWLLVGLVLGGVAGGFITYLYLKSRIPPQTMQAEMPPQIMPYFPAPGVSFTDNPVIIPAETGVQAQGGTHYKNNEMREIQRGPDGRILRTRVVRDARSEAG